VQPSGSKEGRTDGVSVQAGNGGGRPRRAAHADERSSNWRSGNTIPLGQRTLRVLVVRDDDADQPPVLVVEDPAS
jgi:hypothetical protein